MEKEKSCKQNQTRTITFDFSGTPIQKIALSISEKRANELAKELNGYAWKVNEILDGIDNSNPIYLILVEK